MTSKGNVKHEKLKLQYVGSGFAISFRLNVADNELTDGISKSIIDTSQFLTEKLNSQKISICGLFNAFNEDTIPPKVGNGFKDLFTGAPMFADSGGLQAMQQNGSIDDDAKQRIYAVQSQWSNVAMSFDEMPFRMRGGERIYLGDEIAGRMGTTAGQNLREQIRFFNEWGTDSKIVPIVQGQGDGTKNYTLNMLGELTTEQIEQLEHISMGGIIWENSFSILEKAVNLYRMEGIPPKMLPKLHLLGTTGFRKLLPTLIGARNGLLPSITNLSFDSTALLRSYTRGFVHPSIDETRAGKPYPTLGKVRTPAVEAYYEELFTFWNDMDNNIFSDVEDMIEHSCYNGDGLHTETRIFNQYGLEAGIKSVAQTIYYVHYNTFKFLQILEMYLNGEIELSEFMGNYRDLYLLEELESINCVDDFHHWYDENVRKIIEDSKNRRDP